MRSKNIRNICIGLIIVIVLTWGFICLILFVTPWLYSLHPINVGNNHTNETSEKTVEAIDTSVCALADTIIITNDTIRSHILAIINKDTNADDTAVTIEKLGTFGDSAGFWNAIFSALAMIGVLITILYQTAKDSRDDERIIIAQFQEQCFTMIGMLSEIVSELKINLNQEHSFNYDITPVTGWIQSVGDRNTSDSNDNDKFISGRACFKYIYDEKPNGKSIGGFIVQQISENQEVGSSEDLYKSLRKITSDYFDHYFRTIYRILKFIKEADLGKCRINKQEEVRNLCADLLRAQLSTYELAVIYYNGLYPKFRNTSKKIYEHFCIFDNLDPRVLILEKEREYYDFVRTQHKDHPNYDEKIHYKSTAFTDQLPTTSNRYRVLKRKLKYYWHRVKRRFSKNKPNDSTSRMEEENADVINVMNYIKEKNGEYITYSEFCNKLHFNRKKIIKIIKFLKSNKYIAVHNSRNGNKYDILKELV